MSKECAKKESRQWIEPVAIEPAELDSGKLTVTADRLDVLASMVFHITGAALTELAAGSKSVVRLELSAAELLGSLQDEAQALETLAGIYRSRAESVSSTGHRHCCKGKSVKGGKCACVCKKAPWWRPRDAKGHFLPLRKKGCK